MRTITVLGKERLEKLIEFIGQLPPEKFNFEVWTEETSCGTVACAAGWLPQVFPDDWILSGDEVPRLRANGCITPRGDLERFFEFDLDNDRMDYKVVDDLFSPWAGPYPIVCNTSDLIMRLDKTASPEEWVNHATQILACLEVKEAA